MYATLLGRAGFRKGMDLYFQRHDGSRPYSLPDPTPRKRGGRGSGVRAANNPLGPRPPKAGVACLGCVPRVTREEVRRCAVTCDDFRAAMADANGVDLTQFERWYGAGGFQLLRCRSLD
jgi:aminopeptidase N